MSAAKPLFSKYSKTEPNSSIESGNKWHVLQSSTLPVKGRGDGGGGAGTVVILWPFFGDICSFFLLQK